MKEIRFNYCIPREYVKKETNEISYALTNGGDAMKIDTLANIQSFVTDNMCKAGCPWLQVFANGYRVTNDNIDWKDWNGITFSDIDSKWYYNYEKKWNVEKLLNAIDYQAQELYNDNYYCSYITGSGIGYRILWYWDCDRTEENFIKCALLTEKYTKELFYSLGEDTKQIIDYNYQGHKVMDSCSKSIKQGLYVSKYKPLFSGYISCDTFGYCDLNEVSIDNVLEASNIYKNNSISNQHDTCNFITRKVVKKETIKYYPHALRRCIYEALIRLFSDKEKVDTEWSYIANLIPEQNGHNTKFYINEPNKNCWYKRYNNSVIHKLDWLIPFGYTYDDNLTYIYINQFSKSWKKHCKKQIIDIYLNSEDIVQQKKDYVEERKENLKNEIERKYNKLNTSDIRGIEAKTTELEEAFDNMINDNINNGTLNVLSDDFLTLFSTSEQEKILKIRKRYYDTRWQAKDFKHLLDGYELAKDIVTYKMYADFYYRDEDNKPLLKYDILEDNIQTYSYWAQNSKYQWHMFKYGNEYTHWRNNDTFSNKAKKEDIREAIDKYVPRWFSYHSVKEYWKNLDLSIANEEILETWAIRYFNCADTKLTRFICKSFFIAAVKKQMIEDPTTWVYPHILTIQGPTGCGKSFFLKTMFTFDGHELILNKINPNDPDNIIGPLVGRNMLLQFGEGGSLKKADVNTQKEFVDRMNMGFKFQKKYENEQTIVYPRIMICRTSNEDVLFNDASISEGDRRNLLLVCKCDAMCCDEKMREQIKKEKDIIWATAYKLYLENPDIDLQLDRDMFHELRTIQEDFKLIKDDDVEEVYNSLFKRQYMTNVKGKLLDEKTFNRQLEHCDEVLKDKSLLATETKAMFGEEYTDYDVIQYINVFPAKWINNYIKAKDGVNMLKLLKDYLIQNGWVMKQNCMYNLKCWCKK